MQLADFDYNLPKELIAQHPLKERDSARLLVLDRGKQTIEHRIFRALPDYFHKGDLIVLNKTKVLPARLKGVRATGGEVEILLLKPKSGLTFAALIRPARIKPGAKLIFNGGKTSGIISAKGEITFQAKDRDSVYALGSMPLPPYIKREPEDADNVYYQTVYAAEEGAIASPTAGLHFTEGLLGKISSSGVNIAYITLHVGYATFRPVRTEDIRAHKMEAEYFKVTDAAWELIEKARQSQGRIFAVGTTSLRALEASYSGPKQGWTDLFIYPGYKFNMASCLLTNFHLPRTTLFMLVCAFAGEKLIKKTYQEAIERKYRFYSYGDAMLII